MKATGIVRRIDDLGRVVIPKEIRKTTGIVVDDQLEIFTDRDDDDPVIVLRRYEVSDTYVNNIQRLISVAQDDYNLKKRDEVIELLQKVKDILDK